MHQPHFLLQQQHFKQIAHRFRVADDVVDDGLRPIALAHLARGFKNGHFAAREVAVAGSHHAQGAGVFQQALQQGALGGFVQLGVIRLHACSRQQFGQHGLVLVRTLAQIHGGQMETKHLHGAYQGV